MISLREQAIAAIQKDPRGKKHWRYTSKYIDQLIRESLPNSPFLKYNPRTWLPALFQSYYNLRSHYWGAFFESVLKKPEKRLPINLFAFIDLKIPLYIRVLGMLIRICVDRIADKRLYQLPALPTPFHIHPFAFGIAGSGLIINVDDYLNKISNGLFEKIHLFFKECRGNPPPGMNESLSYSLLFPISISDISKYQEFAINLNKEFNSVFSGEGKVNHSDGLILYTPGYVEFLESPEFGSKILVKIGQFLKDLITSYGSSEETKELTRLCELFQYCFHLIPSESRSFSAAYYEMLTANLIIQEQDVDLFNNLTFDTLNSSPLLADIEKSPEIFSHSLDLFDKPFIKLPDGVIVISLFWLYDSLINYYTRLLTKHSISQIRGSRAENYITFLIDYELKAEQLNNLVPFKLILTHPQEKMPHGYDELKRKLPDFKYPWYEIIVPDDIKAEEAFTYYDVDCALCCNEKLLLVEIKDDLFWDIRDLPYFYLLWYKKIKERLEHVKNLLDTPELERELKKKNLSYKQIETLVLTQPHINHPSYKSVYDLAQDIISFVSGKYVMVFWTKFPAYPF